MKANVLLFMALWVASLSSCVSVAVRSSNKTPDGQKIEKIFVLVHTEGEYVDYFTKSAQHLTKLLEKRGVGTDFFVLREIGSNDEAAAFNKKFEAFGDCHVLELRKAAFEEQRDETHVNESAKLLVTLRHSSEPRIVWQSVVDVSGGGVLGFGTIEAGAGGKLTADKILLQLQQDGILARD